MILNTNYHHPLVRIVMVFIMLLQCNAHLSLSQEVIDNRAVTFSPAEQSQIEKADELIMKGERIFSDIVGKDADAKSKKQGGLFGRYGQKEKANDLQESQLRAISMYYAGYSKKSKVFKNRLERFNAENPNETAEVNRLLVSYEKRSSQASASYRKSRSIKSLDEAVKLGEAAVDLHKEWQKEILDNLSRLAASKSVTISQEVAVVEEIKPSTEVKLEDQEDNSIKPVETQSQSLPVSTAVVVPTAGTSVNEVGGDELYYSVQILADKDKVNDEQLARAYSGSLEVYENYGEGWYRYSVGKFNSYQEAIKVMQLNNLKGHPVAYLGKKRISLVEAKKMSEKEIPVVSKKETAKKTATAIIKPDKSKAGDTYFTIQIMADRKKATSDQIKRIYSGALKVDEIIGEGWFRYSIGRFSSHEEAVKVMKSENVKGFVVAYSQSKRITIGEAKKLLSN